jgi:hypothetical protein
MTLNQLSSYQALCVHAYMQFCVALTNKSMYTMKDVSNEFDWDLWQLSEVLGIITAYKFEDEHNAFTNEEMNQWRDIFNDITNTNHYLDFTN